MAALRRHVRDRHDPEAAKPQCSYCKRTWNRVELANKHVATEHLGNAKVIFTKMDPTITPVKSYKKPFEALTRYQNNAAKNEDKKNVITIDLTKAKDQNRAEKPNATPTTSPTLNMETTQTPRLTEQTRPQIVRIVGVTKRTTQKGTSNVNCDINTTAQSHETPRVQHLNPPRAEETEHEQWITTASTNYPPSDMEDDDDDNLA